MSEATLRQALEEPALDVERLARAVHIVEQGTFKTQRCYHDATTGEPVDCKWTAELLAAEYNRLKP